MIGAIIAAAGVGFWLGWSLASRRLRRLYVGLCCRILTAGKATLTVRVLDGKFFVDAHGFDGVSLEDTHSLYVPCRYQLDWDDHGADVTMNRNPEAQHEPIRNLRRPRRSPPRQDPQ